MGSRSRALELLQFLLICDRSAKSFRHVSVLSAHLEVLSIGAHFDQRTHGLFDRLLMALLFSTWAGRAATLVLSNHAFRATEVVGKCGSRTTLVIAFNHASRAAKVILKACTRATVARISLHAGRAAEIIPEGGTTTALVLADHARWAPKVLINIHLTGTFD